MNQKVIITCAISGAEVTRQNNPALPLTPLEIADAAVAAQAAGAAILHLHVRDENGAPTQDVAVFQETIALIRSRCDIVIEVTTGGAVGMTFEERMKVLQLEPEMASLDCGTCNFGDDYIINTLPEMRRAALEMKERRIRPTLECFDLSHIDSSLILIEEDLMLAPLHYGLVMNVPAGLRYDRAALEFLTNRLPVEAYWTLIGIGGRISTQKIHDAMAAGGHIRVGFEDNVWFEKGRLARSNAELVERAAQIARNYGRDVATTSEVRTLFKLRNEYDS